MADMTHIIIPDQAMLLHSSSKHLKKLTLLSKKENRPAEKRKNPA